MLNNLYDTDCVTWNPKGKLLQVDYAMEAVKQGSICVGARNRTHAVLCTLKKSKSELASFQEKIFKVDDHIGMAISGLTADARVICKYMRNECLNHKYVYDSPHPFGRLLNKVAEKSQVKTQRQSKRPYGVGLLVIGNDQDGPHLYETSPSGDLNEYFAYSIGARSQSARTYLENNFERFPQTSLENLILHAVKAVSTSIQDEAELNSKSIEVAVVGVDHPFTILSPQENQAYLTRLPQFKPEEEIIPE